jgi:rfaE bifunctional protein nucleotidyltransferase chain/domain/rfaE bifunctional protein kinase chain/domain
VTGGRRLVVVGDALLDRDLDGSAERLSPDSAAPVVDDPTDVARPGGAALAAALAAGDGHDVTLVTALGRDDAGHEVAALLAAAGVTLVDLGHDGATPEKTRVRVDGRSLVRIDRGGHAAGRIGALTADARTALARADAVLVADYGRGVTGQADLRSALAGRRRGVPLIWDPHTRGAEPVPDATVVTPNRAEAAAFAPAAQLVDSAPVDTLAGVAARARVLRQRWRATAVAVTLGRSGALLEQGDGAPLVQPARAVACFDPCGAGDRFASAVAGLLADGRLVSEAVAGGVTAATDFVAAGGAAAVRIDVADSDAMAYPAEPATGRVAHDVVAATRLRGGTVVATGGCFDILHAGHVSVLQAARSLGDCLVVCLNSDESVRRRKGAGRPLQTAADRASVLLALGCVDAVAEFDEDTPVDVLRRLRPDVWVKGGDYALTDLPEAPVVREWGGQAVVLPYLEGRSTTAIVKEAAARGSRT